MQKTIDGNLITLNRDNIKGSVNSFSITEFQRGDAVEFILKNDILDKQFINKGDTIGFIYSNEEQRKLIELEGNLKILESEYLFYNTGQKPEDVERAKQQLLLAEQEFETEKQLMDRTEILYKDSVILKQQYEIKLNELKVKELAVSIAEANYESVTTGDKPEQAILINSKMQAVNWQISQLKSRLDYFTVLSPLDGMIAMNRSQTTNIPQMETILKVLDIERKVGIIPIRISELKYFDVGSKVYLDIEQKQGTVIGIDNVAQNNWLESSIYLTAEIENAHDLKSGMITEVEIEGKALQLWDYIKAILTKS